jgi:signal transduction histidine kinase
MKLKLLFALIILYIIAGFGWWSYSLIQFSNNEYKLKIQLLETGKQTSELKIVDEARSFKFLSPLADSFKINGVFIQVDTNKLQNYVQKTFNDRYQLKFEKSNKYQRALLVINPATINQLNTELRMKERSFAIEAILLTLLIAIGIFGVYYSVTFVFDLNKQQNNFLLSVTHELKTPIAAIRLIGETIMMRSLPQEKQKELIGTILENSRRLQDMTENMLTAMQMESNRYNIRKEEIDLSGIVNEVMQNFALKNEISGKVETNISYFGDPVLLKMTLNNLVENAIKYSDNKPVELNLLRKNDTLIIEVKDQGIGIEKEYRKRIFRRFYRIQDEETRETKGSGLGLFIVKQAVEKHKGKIIISDNFPKGTVFTITFQALS